MLKLFQHDDVHVHSQRASSDPLLKGVHAGSMNDVIHRNWLSKLWYMYAVIQKDQTGSVYSSLEPTLSFIGHLHLGSMSSKIDVCMHDFSDINILQPIWCDTLDNVLDHFSYILYTVTLSNTQIALQGLEKTGYILVSSHIAQVFGREHEPQLNEGDLVTKKSWVAKVQELQVCFSLSLSLSLSL